MSDPALIAALHAAGVDVAPEDAPAVVLDRLQAVIVRSFDGCDRGDGAIRRPPR